MSQVEEQTSALELLPEETDNQVEFPEFLPAPNPISSLLLELDKVMQSDDYDEEYLRPSAQARSLAEELLRNACSDEQLGKLPHSYVIPDGIGGLRLRWKLDDKEVTLNCAASAAGKSYIYHQHQQEHGVDYGVEIEKLTAWLAWLIAK